MRLKDIIETLKQEIRESQVDGKDGMFKLKECEVELGIEFEATGGAKIELSVPMLKFSGGGELTRTATHSIKLKMEPFTYDERPSTLPLNVSTYPVHIITPDVNPTNTRNPYERVIAFEPVYDKLISQLQKGFEPIIESNQIIFKPISNIIKE